MIPGLQYQINKQRRVENGEDGVEALRGGWTRSASMAGSQSFFGNVAAMTLEEARGRIGDERAVVYQTVVDGSLQRIGIICVE